MPRLFHTLGMGADSLYSSRQGVDTAGHNIANAQVEGYSRQRIKIHQRDPLFSRGVLIGNGAYVGRIKRSHDQFIEDQINKANQSIGFSDQKFEGLRTVELVFSPEMSASISDELTQFFNAWEDLSNFPEDVTVRTAVLEQGRNVSSAFNRIDQTLKQHRLDFNDQLMHTATDLSDKLETIAKLNVRIKSLEAGGSTDANDLRDQRDRALRDVTKMISVSYYEDQYGMVMVRGPSEVTLVDGGNAAVVGVSRNEKNVGLYDVIVTDWEGTSTRNVTDSIDSGSMFALVEMRDKTLPVLLEKNNEMAYEFINRFNAIHQQGFGVRAFSEQVGRNFFKQPSSLEMAASEAAVDEIIISSVDSISAGSTPNAPGDNVIANELIRLKDDRFMGGGNATMHEFYGNFIGNLGLEVMRAERIRDADKILSDDLMTKRESISGVSIDEEATDLLKWQSAFTASSKVITTVDEMLETLLGMKR